MRSVKRYSEFLKGVRQILISTICRFIAYVHLHNKPHRFQTANFTFIVSLFKNANCIFMLNTLSPSPYLSISAPWTKTRALIKPWIQYSSTSESFIKRLSRHSLRIIKYFVEIGFWQMLWLMCAYWKGRNMIEKSVPLQLETHTYESRATLLNRKWVLFHVFIFALGGVRLKFVCLILFSHAPADGL